MDEQTRTEIEAAAFRRLLSHLAHRTDVQNIDLMGLAGFCRNCLANWIQDAAAEKGIEIDKTEIRAEKSVISGCQERSMPILCCQFTL